MVCRINPVGTEEKANHAKGRGQFANSIGNPDDGQFLVAFAAIPVEMAVVGDEFERWKQFAA
jgi:hypothetical protein